MRNLNLPWVPLSATAAIVVGSLLHWVTVLGVSVNGVQTSDGKLVLVLALVSAVLLTASAKSQGAAIAAGLAGLAALGVSVYDTIRIDVGHKEIFGFRIGASVGAGLWIDVIAGMLLVAAIALHLRQRSDQVDC